MFITLRNMYPKRISNRFKKIFCHSEFEFPRIIFEYTSIHIQRLSWYEIFYGGGGSIFPKMQLNTNTIEYDFMQTKIVRPHFYCCDIILFRDFPSGPHWFKRSWLCRLNNIYCWLNNNNLFKVIILFFVVIFMRACLFYIVKTLKSKPHNYSRTYQIVKHMPLSFNKTVYHKSLIILETYRV